MSTTVSRLKVELTLDDKDFKLSVKGSTAALERFKGGLTKADKVAKKHESTLKGLTTSFRHTVVTLGLMREAFRTAWRMSGGLVQGIVNITAEFERLQVLLQGMSKATTEIERTTDAADQFNQVINLAKSAPFTVKELTNSWVKFRSVGVDPSTGSLKSLIDAVARFGGTDDIMHRATIAVQQMAGKGVISMEELRQQMGEAVPQSLVLLARGMNMSVGQMVTKISSGSVEAQSALGKLFAEFELTFGGASQKLMETYIGSLSRLSTVWQLTVNEIGQSSGLFDNVKRVLQEMIVRLDDPAIRRIGIDIGIALAESFKTLEAVVRKTIQVWKDYGETIKTVVVFLASYRAAMILSTIVTKSFVAQAGLSVLTLAGTRIKDFIQALIAFRSIVFASSLAVSGLGAAIKAMLATNPVGWALLLAGALVTVMYATRDTTDAQIDGIEHLERYKEASEESAIAVAKLQIAEKKRALELAKNRQLANQFSRDNDIATWGKTKVAEQEQALADSIAKMEKEVLRLDKLVLDVVNGAARRAADASGRAMEQIFRDGLMLARNEARGLDMEIDTMYTNKEINDKQRLEMRLKVWADFQQKQKDFVLERLEAENKLIDEYKEERAKTTEKEEIDLWNTRIKVATDNMRQIARTHVQTERETSNAIAHIRRDNAWVEDTKKIAEDQLKALETFFKSATGKFAGLNAQLKDGKKETEKFLALVAAGTYGDVTKAGAAKDLFEQILALVKGIDEAAEKLKNKNAFEQSMKAVGKVLAKAKEEAEQYRQAVDGGFNEVANGRVRKFHRQLAGLRETWIATGKTAAEFKKVADETLRTLASISVDEKVLAVRTEILEVDAELEANARRRFDLEQALADDQFEAFLRINVEGRNVAQLRDEYDKLARKKREAFENNQPIRKLARDWQDVMGNMEQAGANWINSFADSFTDALIQGKFAFKDFAKEVLKELLKIMVRAMIARAIMASIGQAGQVDTGNSDIGLDSFNWFKKGGIMTPDGPVKHYARGGIATRPQISVFGEGDQNEAYVPLPDGRSIPVSLGGRGASTPNVTVNVINESGNDVDAEQEGGLQFDGEGYVLDVVLKAAHRPGQFRDGLQSAVK